MKEDLNDLVAFIAVARERNFTRAAAQIGMSQSALSRTVSALETRMGAPLLMRTTRSVSLTDVGERLVAAIEPRLADIRAEFESLQALTTGPAGTVRITVTDLDANIYLIMFLSQFGLMMRLLAHGLVRMTSLAKRSTSPTRSNRRLNRYCTSAK